MELINNRLKLNNEELRKLQLNLLAIIIEVDRICRKNNIKYTLAGGTMLGAVRHKGFIPWDDDADVRFSRREYEKFFDACKKDLDTEHFFLQDYRTDPGYRWGYAKMRLKGTEYIRSGQEHMHYVTGVNIDIFIADNVPETPIQRKIIRSIAFAIRKTLYSELGMKQEKTLQMRTFYKCLYHLVPRDFCFKIFNSMLSPLNKRNTEYLCCYFWWEPGYEKSTGKPFGMPRRYYTYYTELEFEGMKFSVVEDYETYLRDNYGDYMTLPPVEKRLPSGPASKMELLDITLDELQKKYYQENAKY